MDYNQYNDQQNTDDQPQNSFGQQYHASEQPLNEDCQSEDANGQISYGQQTSYNQPQNPYSYQYNSGYQAENAGYHYSCQQPALKKKKDGKKKSGSGAVRTVIIAVIAALIASVGSAAAVGGYLSKNMTSKLDAIRAENTELRKLLESAEPETQSVHTTSGGAQSVAGVYSQNVNAVVGITNEGISTNVFGQTSSIASSGSGFIISEDGYIVSNYHVVADATTLTVTLYDGTEYEAEVIGYEATNDVALLKINAEGLTAVDIGDSDALQVGDQVAAVGNPLGELTFTMTVGYVSALDREINTDGTPINMLQTDVAINSGNSGGPLFDMNGNVVGITTAKYSGSTSSGTTIEGIGFAIPINDVMKIVDDLKDFGYVTGQAYLGVTVMDMDANTAEVYSLPLGAYVDTVAEGACADKAGLKSGDIILGLGDYQVESYTDLVAALKKFTAGDSTTLTIFRGGAEQTLNITLDEKPREEQQETQSAEQGSIPAQEGETSEDGQTQPDGGEMPQIDEDMMEQWFNYFFGQR